MSILNLAKKIATAGILAAVIYTFSACTGSNAEADKQSVRDEKKIGVLLVNHGSRSETWRNALLELEKDVRDSIMKDGNVKKVTTAFMEYTEPSIATRMKEFDKEGFTDVIIVPIFLTVSTHSFDDIPTIVGLKSDPSSVENQRLENIARYTPKATVHITPLLDFTDILRKNILKRVQALSTDPANEGLALIAYGDETYNTEWTQLMNTVGSYVMENAGIEHYSYGWCGHIAHYNPDSTAIAINRVLKNEPKAIVIPVLVAHDEMFQIKIIGDGIAKIDNAKERVIYKPDAILQDENVSNWVKKISAEYAQKILKEEQAI